MLMQPHARRDLARLTKRAMLIHQIRQLDRDVFRFIRVYHI